MTIFHPELHPLFETLGYAGGYALYRQARARQGDFLSEEKRWVVIAATAIGALIGSRALGLLEQAPRMTLHWHDVFRPGGKTIVGGLLGGWIAVEIAKRFAGIKSRTGDLFAVPLCAGIAIGRIGASLRGWRMTRMGRSRRCRGAWTLAMECEGIRRSSMSWCFCLVWRGFCGDGARGRM